jgi:hypothetical protein
MHTSLTASNCVCTFNYAEITKLANICKKMIKIESKTKKVLKKFGSHIA